MTVVSCLEYRPGRRRGRIADTFQEELSRFFRVTTDDPADDFQDAVKGAIALGLLPAISTAHPKVPTALLRSFSGGEEDANTPLKWLVELTYSTDASDPYLQAGNPLNEAAQIDFDTERFAQGDSQDLDGKPFVNSAGDPYASQSLERGVLICRYRDNVSVGAGSQIIDYLYHANEVEWMGQAPKTILIQRFKLYRNYRNGVVYFQRDIEFKVAPTVNGEQLDWTIDQKVDVGRNVLSPDGTRAIGAAVNGSSPSAGVLLDGQGQALSRDRVLNGEFFAFTFRVRDTADFNAIVPPIQTINF